jgi:hypothetical protein
MSRHRIAPRAIPWLRKLWPRLAASRERFRDHVLSIQRSLVLEADCDSMTAEVPNWFLTFRRGTLADLSAFGGEENGYGTSDLEFCKTRFRSGDSLFIGELNTEIVFSAWLMYGQVDVDRSDILRTHPGVAYSYKLLTLRHVRGLRICTAYYRFLKQLLLSEGYTRLVCRITPGNRASLRAHSRAGFRHVGTVSKLVIGPYRYYFADAPVRKWLQRLTPDDHIGKLGTIVVARRSEHQSCRTF